MTAHVLTTQLTSRIMISYASFKNQLTLSKHSVSSNISGHVLSPLLHVVYAAVKELSHFVMLYAKAFLSATTESIEGAMSPFLLAKRKSPAQPMLLIYPQGCSFQTPISPSPASRSSYAWLRCSTSHPLYTKD